MADRVITVRLNGDVSAYNRAMASAAHATTGVGGAAQTTGQRIGSAIATGAKVAAAAVVAGAAIGAAKVLEIGMAYEQQMQILQAVSQSTAAKMDEVAVKARALGSDLEIPGTSAADAAGAMTELAKGGLSVDQAMQAAKGTLQLAAAAQIDGATAAGIQSNALNAFGLKASDAAHVADVLANTANAASGEITDFASGLQQSSAVASSFGISIDETSTVLGLFANRGIQGSDAGTSFKTMLIAMANPTAKAQSALDKLGVTTHDAAGNFVGMRTVTEQLSAAKQRMTQAEFTSAAATAFGTDAMRAAVVMADGGAVAFDQMAMAVSRQGGAADLSKAQMEGLSGALGVAESATEDVALAFYDRFSPAIEGAVRKAAERLPEIADAVFDVLDKVETFATQVGPSVSSGLRTGAADLRTQAEQLLLPLLEGARDLGSKSAPYIIEFGEKLWAAIMKVGDAISPVTDALGDLMSTLAQNGFIDQAGRALSELGSSLSALGAVLAPIGELIGGAINLLGEIPGPVMLGVTAFTLLVVLMPRILSGLATVGAYALTMGTRVVAGAGMASAAFTRLQASMGVLGWVLAAAGTAFAVFAGSSTDADTSVADTKATVEEFTATLDINTAALTKNSRINVTNRLESEGHLKVLRDAGVNTEKYIDAIMAQEGAESDVAAAIQDRVKAVIEGNAKYGEMAQVAADAKISTDELAAAAVSGDWASITTKLGDYNKALAQGGEGDRAVELTKFNDAVYGVIGGTEPLVAAYRAADTESRIVTEGIASQTRVIEANGGAWRMIEAPSPLTWDKVKTAMDGAATGLDGVAKGAALVPEPMSLAEQAVQGVKDAAEEADTAAQGLIIAMDMMAGRAPDVEAQQRLLESSIRDFGSAMRDVPAAQRDIEQATADVTQAEIDYRAAVEETAAVNADGEKTQDDRTAAKLAEEAAARKVTDAVAAEAESKRGVADADDELAEAGRAVYENAIVSASAAGALAAELGGTAAGADAAAASMQKARDDFTKTAREAGLSAGKAAELADKLGLVPDDVKTNFIAQTDPALAALDKLVQRMDEVNGKTITTYANQINSMGTLGDNTSYGSGEYMGGPVPAGYAAGGSPGNGGQLPGTPPSNPTIDNLIAYGPNGKPLRLRSKEWIIQQPTTDAIGARGMAMVNSGELNGLIKAAADGSIPGFATGGVPSGAALAGKSAASYTDRLGNVVGALMDLAGAVDDAAETARELETKRVSARDKVGAAQRDADGDNGAARDKRREAEKKADDVAAEQAKKVTTVATEQAKKVADARATARRKNAEVAAAQARKVAEAETRLAEARKTTGEGRADAIAKAEKSLSKARSDSARVLDETRDDGARSIAKAQTAQAKANASATAARDKATKAAEAAEVKARAAEKKVNDASDAKVKAAQKEFDAATKEAATAKQRAKDAEQLERVQATQARTLRALGATYDKVTDQLESARDMAAGLRADRAAASSSIANSLSGFGGGITGASDLRLDAASIIAGQQQNLAQVQGFAANLAKGQANGIDAKLLQEIADAGVSGGGTTAAAIANATSAQIKQMNTLASQINATAKRTGDGVGDALYKAGIQAADGIVAGLASKQSAVEAAMAKLGEQMAKAMKTALGIKSPSTVMRDQVGAQIVNGVIAGIEGRSAALNAKVSDLVTIPPVSFSNPAEGVFTADRRYSAGAMGADAPLVEIHVTGDGAMAQMIRDVVDIRVNGVLVKATQKVRTAAGQAV